jgi:hypothetical protein
MKKNKIEIPEVIITPYKYSQKVTLHPGDEFRCSGGPYYLTKTGKKIIMGQRGLFRFVNSAQEGIMATKKETVVFIYMGENKVSESTGTHFVSHKIRKCRK